MQIVRDPIWQNIEFPESLSKIIETSEFLRLNDIKQLGPTYLVYPGATHTRFAHSLGVYHVANCMIHSFINKGFDFFSDEGVKAFKIASLCHDLGHFPYTHALKELPLLDHEKLTGLIITQSNLSKVIEECGVNPEFVAKIIDKELETDNKEIIFFRKILSGVLDPDKLDYLNRDAFYCGVPYGIQDTDFTINSIIPDSEKGITVDSKSIVAIENLLFSKYLMYRTVYWHKNVRIATAMMKKTLFAALSANQLKDKDLYDLTDNQLVTLVDSKTDDEIWHCAKKLFEKKLYQIVFEADFYPDNPIHVKMQDLQYRTKVEKEIARHFNMNNCSLLIDIPEKISFESNIWINDENCEFSKSPTVFSEYTVKSFTEKLRKIRIAIDGSVFERKSEKDLQNMKKFISEVLQYEKNGTGADYEDS